MTDTAETLRKRLELQEMQYAIELKWHWAETQAYFDLGNVVYAAAGVLFILYLLPTVFRFVLWLRTTRKESPTTAAASVPGSPPSSSPN